MSGEGLVGREQAEGGDTVTDIEMWCTGSLRGGEMEPSSSVRIIPVAPRRWYGNGSACIRSASRARSCGSAPQSSGRF